MKDTLLRRPQAVSHFLFKRPVGVEPADDQLEEVEDEEASSESEMIDTNNSLSRSEVTAYRWLPEDHFLRGSGGRVRGT